MLKKRADPSFSTRETARSSSLARGLGLVGSSESGDTSSDGFKGRKGREEEEGRTVVETFSFRNTFVQFAISIYNPAVFAASIVDSVPLESAGIGFYCEGRGEGVKVLRFATECENQTSLNIQKGR